MNRFSPQRVKQISPEAAAFHEVEISEVATNFERASAQNYLEWVAHYGKWMVDQERTSVPQTPYYRSLNIVGLTDSEFYDSLDS